MPSTADLTAQVCPGPKGDQRGGGGDVAAGYGDSFSLAKKPWLQGTQPSTRTVLPVSKGTPGAAPCSLDAQGPSRASTCPAASHPPFSLPYLPPTPPAGCLSPSSPTPLRATPQHSTHTNLTRFVCTHILPSRGLCLARVPPALTCPLITGHITLLVAGLKPQGPGWTPKLTTAQHGPLPELQTQRRQQRPSNTDTVGQHEAEEAKAQVEAWGQALEQGPPIPENRLARGWRKNKGRQLPQLPPLKAVDSGSLSTLLGGGVHECVRVSAHAYTVLKRQESGNSEPEGALRNS